MKFSVANEKIKNLASVAGLKPFLTGRRKVYSFDLISGWSCPFASDCLSKVHIIDGKKKVVDGPNTQFRCFSASQEVLFPNVYNNRMGNYTNLRKLDAFSIADLIDESMPSNAGIIRFHVAGDFFNKKYFYSLLLLAIRNPSVLFYAYTKSLPYWIEYRKIIPDNVVLTASYGGRCDNLIGKHRLRSAKVVFSRNEAKQLGLDIDKDDSHAADPTKRKQSFALLLHGVQPKGTKAAQALVKLKGDGSYGKKR